MCFVCFDFLFLQLKEEWGNGFREFLSRFIRFDKSSGSSKNFVDKAKRVAESRAVIVGAIASGVSMVSIG